MTDKLDHVTVCHWSDGEPIMITVPSELLTRKTRELTPDAIERLVSWTRLGRQ